MKMHLGDTYGETIYTACGAEYVGRDQVTPNLDSVTCVMCRNEYLIREHRDWQKWSKDFDYAKEFYDVRLPSGEIIKCCWPNAGKMIDCHNNGREWGPNANIEVRISDTMPWEEFK